MLVEIIYVFIKSAPIDDGFYQYSFDDTNPFYQVMVFLRDLRNLEILYLETPFVFYTTMILMLMFTIPFIFAILQLLQIQIGNFRMGLTTNERFGRKVY